MTASLFPALAAAAVTIGALHSVAPDHWVPIATMARARGWSAGRTVRVALLCGFGHVTVSVLLGLLALIFGLRVVSALGARAASVSGLLLIGFGTAYALWGLRRAVHGHVHADPSRTAVSALFAIYCADPCIAVVPILFAAAPLPVPAIIALVAIYEAATILTIVGLAAVARAGIGVVKGEWVERYGDAAAGLTIVVTGLVVGLLGW